MKRILVFFTLFGVAIVTGCDLQPKIVAIPDTVGDFISQRYPTLLAEPDSEIYETAVADYGVYASPTLYGDGDVTAQDYVLYSSSDDYFMPAQDTDVDAADVGMPDDKESQIKETDDQDEYAQDTYVQDLVIPDYVNEKPVEKKEPVTQAKSESESKSEKKSDAKSVPLREITIKKGDTLYALSHKYSVTVDDLATVNKLSAPFKLYVGQKLNVPDVLSVPQYKAEPNVARVSDTKVVAETKQEIVQKNVEKTAPEIKDVKKSEVKKEPSKVDEKSNVKKNDTKPADKVAEKSGDKKVEAKKTEPSGATKKLDVVRVPLRDVTVEKGDTLYSISRKYSVGVNDLATINKLSAPFALSIGQKIKVPDLGSVQKKAKPDVKPTTKDVKKVEKSEPKKVETKKTETKKLAKPEPKKSEPGNAEVKKSEVQKKTETKKTETKKNTTKKQTATKSRTAQKMVARSSSKFSWPVRGKILSGYGSKTNGLFNDGINIKATKGSAVLAAENGLVAYAGNEVKGMGNLVIIQHSDGWMTVYAHMDSMSVRRGHGVSVGQKIGTVGMSGKVDQPQLHFEIRKGTKAYNPVNYLKK